MRTLELSFAFMYLGKCLMKVSVKTFRAYWSVFGNRFDFFATWVLLLTSVPPYLPFTSNVSNLAQYANMLRLFRLFRVLKELEWGPTIQVMCKAVSRIVISGQNLLLLMGLFLFFVYEACVSFFGGTLYERNPKLEGTKYVENH